MNRLAGLMMRLYPAGWRARYGDELDALLADTGADARVVTDLFRGGIRMQFKTWSFLKLAVALGILGALLGAGVALLLPVQYTSVATMELQPSQIRESDVRTGAVDHNQLNELVQILETEVLSRTSLTRIVNDERLQLYPNELRDKPLEDIIEEMKSNISINFVNLPGALGRRATAFDIRFSHPDRFKAQATVRALMGRLDEANQETQITHPDGMNASSLVVLNGASFPISPIYPNLRLLMLGAFLFGILIAVIGRRIQRTGFIARRFALVAVAFGLACLAVVVVADRLEIWPYHYRSGATLALPEGAGPDQITALENAVFSRTSLSVIIQNPRMRLYQGELRTEPLEDVIQMMKQHLKITQDRFPNRTVFDVSFDYTDRYKTQQTVSALVKAFVDAHQRLYPGSIPPPHSGFVLDVLDAASLPSGPSSPNPRKIMLTGGLLGLMVAAIIAMVRRRWKPETDLSRTA